MKGKIVGSRYQVLEHIASGGFGRTYLAEDTQLPGRDRCVVKQLFPNEDSRILVVARRLFETEASTLNDLGYHDQIPELLAYFEEAEKFYLVQQYISGQTLEKELLEHQIWSETQVIELLRDVLSILEFTHSKGVIHRDVKPDNLIRRDGDHKLVLVDFGTVKKVIKEGGRSGRSERSEQLTVAVGTKGYMPAEQARGNPQPSSDLYALGAIAIQLLTGTVPLELAEDDQGNLVWESLADVSPQFAKILTKMTQYHCEDRYQSATEISQALDTLLEVPGNQNQSALALDQENQSNQSKPVHPALLPKPPATTVINAAIATTNDGDRQTGHDDSKQKSLALTSDDSEGISQGNLRNVGDASNVVTSINAVESNEFQSSFKTPNQQRNLGWAIAALATCLIAASIGGLYFLTYRPTSVQELDQPANSNDPSSPISPNTPRKNQGEGFRKDL